MDKIDLLGKVSGVSVLVGYIAAFAIITVSAFKVPRGAGFWFLLAANPFYALTYGLSFFAHFYRDEMISALSKGPLRPCISFNWLGVPLGQSLPWQARFCWLVTS